MPIHLALIVFFISIVIVIRSGSTIVHRLSRVARFFQISEFVAAFVLISIATSLPDFFVGVLSALHGAPELSFSNIIGANIATLTIALGPAVILARGLEVSGSTMRRETLYAAFAAVLPIILFLDGAISRVDGVVLLIFAIWYFIRLVSQRGRFPEVFSNSDTYLINFKEFVGDFFVLAIAAVFLIAGAEGVIQSALAIASSLEISISIIGILLVALSITLPEIVFGVRAVMMGHKSMVLGNVIGSVVVNSGFVIGTTALIAPISVPSFSPYMVGMIFTAIVAAMFILYAHTNKKITTFEGFSLIAVYIIFVFALFAFNGSVV